MQPGNILDPSDLPVTPDPKKQSLYRPMVANLQFAAKWVRFESFDIVFAVGQLARFCASAGPSHWAALHHIMKYLAKYPNFPSLFGLSQVSDYSHRLGALDGYHCDSDLGNSSSRRSTMGNLLRYSLSTARILFSICGNSGVHLSSLAYHSQ